MEASGSSCLFATSQETTLSDQDPEPHPAGGLGANSLMNRSSVTLV